MPARLLTAAAPGAVAVVELAGPDAPALAARLGLVQLEPGPARLVRLQLEVGGQAEARGDAPEVLDEALLVVREGRTPTYELHLHGSPALVAEVLGALAASAESSPGPPLPDTLEQRALSALATAPCEAAARVLLDQAQGALRHEFERLLALPGEDFDAGLRVLAERGARARRLFEPARIVLRGPVNAGKSTLFNALLGYDRALTSGTPGTTRDLVVEPVVFAGWPFELVDTAGDRQLDSRLEPGGRAPVSQEELELVGQQRAELVSSRADLVLLLLPVGSPGYETSPLAGDPPCLRIRTHGDRAEAGCEEPLISALTDPEGACELVTRAVLDQLSLGVAWRAGVAVPFDQATREVASRADLERLLGGEVRSRPRR